MTFDLVSPLFFKFQILPFGNRDDGFIETLS